MTRLAGLAVVLVMAACAAACGAIIGVDEDPVVDPTLVVPGDDAGEDGPGSD